MKSILLITLSLIFGSVLGKAQTVSTPFIHREISVELPGEWSFSSTDDDKEEYMFIGSNKDRDHLFVFVSKQGVGAYNLIRFEEGVNRCLKGAQKIRISNIKELIFDGQKVYKSNVYKDGELFRIAYGSVVNGIEYYVLLDLMKIKQPDNLFRKVKINQPKPNLILPDEEDVPLSELEEIFPNSQIPKDAVVRKFGDIRIWFDADDLVKVENKINEEGIETVLAVSLNMKDGIPLGIAILSMDFADKGVKNMTQTSLKRIVLKLLSGITEMDNINFQELQAGLFRGRFCYSTIGYLNGELERKMIVFYIGAKVYFCYTTETSNLNTANRLLSKILLEK